MTSNSSRTMIAALQGRVILTYRTRRMTDAAHGYEDGSRSLALSAVVG